MEFQDLPDIGETKRKNIVEIGLSFTAMTRLFARGSKRAIESKLLELFSTLTEINTREEYEQRHRSFCEWFIGKIQTAEKKLKNGRAVQSDRPSYGQAAKVLDIAIKVYVYYCTQPAPEIAQKLLPLLHGAVDTPILTFLKGLKKPEFAANPISATTIKEVDERTYHVLQALVVEESSAHSMHPVQFDDVLWRMLSRELEQ